MTHGTAVAVPGLLTMEQREEFDRRGYLIIPNSLTPAMLDRLLVAHDRVFAEEATAGRLGADGSLHLFAFVRRDPVYVELLDLPTTFPLVCGFLGWNIYMYHCHLDVHPPLAEPPPSRWGWHQDGGRQNLEIETQPIRPRLSVKVAYFLSDASEPGRGNFTVLPGSHIRNAIPRPDPTESEVGQLADALPILAEPGTAVLFDRRLWHSRSDNLSSVTRKALFLGYTYRWIRSRDDVPTDPEWLAGIAPIRRHLMGDGPDAMSYWGLGEDEAPLRTWLSERGLLDPTLPAHR